MRAHGLTGTVVAMAIVTMAAVSACRKETPQNPATGAAPPPAVPAESKPSTGISTLVDKLSITEPPAQGSRAAAIVQAAKPVAESRQIERRPSAATTGEQEFKRVEFESVDSTRLFPPVSATVPGVWNGWYVNHSIDAFREAIDKNKPLVLVAAEDWCKYCIDLAHNVLRCPAVDRFAGDAVFAFSFLAEDRGATAIAGSLKIDAYPAITVIEPESRMLIERGRINGYFEASRLGGHLDTILWKTQPRVLPDDFDLPPAQQNPNPAPRAPWKPDPLGPASTIGAEFGAVNHRLTHAPPAPQCR